MLKTAYLKIEPSKNFPLYGIHVYLCTCTLLIWAVFKPHWITYMKSCPLWPVSLVVAVLGGGAWQRVNARVRVTPVESHWVSAEVLHRPWSRRLAKYQSYMYKSKHGTNQCLRTRLCIIFKFNSLFPNLVPKLLPPFQCCTLKISTQYWKDGRSLGDEATCTLSSIFSLL